LGQAELLPEQIDCTSHDPWGRLQHMNTIKVGWATAYKIQAAPTSAAAPLAQSHWYFSMLSCWQLAGICLCHAWSSSQQHA